MTRTRTLRTYPYHDRSRRGVARIRPVTSTRVPMERTKMHSLELSTKPTYRHRNQVSGESTPNLRRPTTEKYSEHSETLITISPVRVTFPASPSHFSTLNVNPKYPCLKHFRITVRPGQRPFKFGKRCQLQSTRLPMPPICPRTGQKICFDVLDISKYPWGRGATGQPIMPLLTVAVDQHSALERRSTFLNSTGCRAIPNDALSTMAALLLKIEACMYKVSTWISLRGRPQSRAFGTAWFQETRELP